MLSEIIEGRESSDFTLLTDQFASSAQDLFYVFLNNFVKKYDSIHVFLFENLQYEFCDQLQPGVRDKIFFHDFSSDPLGWNNPNSPSKVLPDFNFTKIIGESPGIKNTALVIDSFDALLRHCNIQKLSFMLQNFTQTFSKNGVKSTILGLVHRDLCDKITLNSIEYSASNVINLVTEKEIRGVSGKGKKTIPKSSNLCKIVHKKKHGKFAEFVEIFTVSRGVLLNSKPWIPESNIRDADNLQGGDFSSENDEEIVSSTFNLSLSKDEKEARSKLVMPYMKKPTHLKVKMDEDTESKPSRGISASDQSQESIGGVSAPDSSRGSSASSGFIYYEPDEADDFDEEDPDDDLDF